MKDDAKNQLKRILDGYDVRVAETARVDAADRAAKAAFPERFAILKKEVILPALAELAALLSTSGHEATTREQEESSSTAGGVMSASVGLRVIPKPLGQKPMDARTSFVEVLFSANRSERKVIVSSTNTTINSRANVGKRGEYEVDKLTADLVVGHVLHTLEEALSG